MNITLTGIKIVQDNKFLAFEKNSGVDVINITVDTDDEWTYKLDVKYPDKCCSGEALYNIINLTRTGNVCTAILTSDMLPFAGKYTMQLRGINGDKVAHSDTFDAWVKYSIEPGSTYDPVPSEFYQIEENITEMNNNPPYPSDDGYWMIWDVNTRVYKKSDIKIINGLPEISESTKDMALYNDGEKAEWREQRNPIPDWQENDPESPNYIRNRNGGYYEQGEQFLNAVYPFNSFQIPVAYKNDDPVICVNVNDTDGTKTFWKAFSYFCEKDNLETVGFYLRYTGPGDYSNEQYSYILKYNDGTKSVRMYDATPVIWSSDWLPELPVAGLNKLGVVSAGELEYDPDYYEDVYVRENGALFSPKYLIIINFFEYSESDGAKTNNRPGFYYESVSCGWILKSSNYLAEKLGITSTDFPIQIISEGNVYGSGVPYMNCVFSTRTGKTGGFTWRFNGSVLSSHLNDSSDLLIVRFTNNDGTWSADKTYAEMKQALDDGKTVQGVASDIAAIGYVSGDNIAFYFSLFYSENEQNRYFAYDAIDIIVSEDGIKAFSNNDDLMGSYRRVILPAQTLLVTNNDGALSAVLMAQEQMENPLTYLFNAFNLLPKYTIPTLTALYDKKSNAALTERFYYSNAVATPNSDNTSAKVDFIFKSADATKTLTGSVTIPDGWDGYMPLDETWSYEEIAPFVFGCVTPPTPDGSVTSVTPLNDNYSKSLRAMIHILGGTTDDARAKSYSLFSAIVYTRGYECVCLSLTDFNIDPPDGRYTATFMGNVGKTRIARLSVTSRLTGIGVLDSSGYWETDGLDGAARYDEAQSLTNAQKQQARDNIGVVDIPAPSADNVGMVPVAALADEDENTYGYEMKALADPRVTIFHVTGKGTTAEPYAMDITLDELNAAIAAGNIVFAIRATSQKANPELVYRYQEMRTYTYSNGSTSTEHVFVCVTKPETESVVLKNTPTLEVLWVNTNTGFIHRSSVYAAKELTVAVRNTNGQLKTTVPVVNLSVVATSGFFNSFPHIFISGNNTTPYEIYQITSAQSSGTYPDTVSTVKCTRYDSGKLYELTFTGPLTSNDANDTVVTKTETALLPVSSDGTSFVLNSSTEGSTKRFKITVDDSGTLTAAEVTDETADA